MPAAFALVALVCGLDGATGRYEADCGGHVESVDSLQECQRYAAWLRATAPAGVKVIWHECVKQKATRKEIRR